MDRIYKILQLNVLNFVHFDKIIDFINTEDPDIVTFQEVSENNLMRSKNFADTSKYDGVDYIEELKNRTNLKYGEFFKSWGVRFENGKICNWGNAIFSKSPLIDYEYYFDNQNGGYQLSDKTTDPFFISEEKKIRDIYSMQKPAVFASALFELDGKYLKVFTGHFVISDLCTESLQRVNQVRQLIQSFENQKQYPTIISADFNMTEDGMCVQLLKNRFEYFSHTIDNSLDKSMHPVFDPHKAIRGIVVEKLKVDHILGVGIKTHNCYTREDAGLSDHLPVLLEFSL